jgi:LPS-assembly lipoprotein
VTTRYDVIGTAAFVLTPVGGDRAALRGEVRTITGYSAPDTEAALTFASRAAQRDAGRRLAVTLADQIVQRLALTAGDWAT